LKAWPGERFFMWSALKGRWACSRKIRYDAAMPTTVNTSSETT
jgi:hypothetical protein